MVNGLMKVCNISSTPHPSLLPTMRRAGDIRAGDSATSPAPTRAPSPSTQSPASTVSTRIRFPACCRRRSSQFITCCDSGTRCNIVLARVLSMARFAQPLISLKQQTAFFFQSFDRRRMGSVVKSIIQRLVLWVIFGEVEK